MPQLIPSLLANSVCFKERGDDGMKFRVGWLFLWGIVVSFAFGSERGVVIVSVADLVGQPLATFYPSQIAEISYKTLPWSCYRSHYEANARLHQLLFHEQVKIIERRGNEVCVEVPHVYYTTPNNPLPQTQYWTHAKNILSLSNLSAHGIDICKLPPPINFRNDVSQKNAAIISLIKPWHDQNTGITFSAGTRFLKTVKQPKTGMVVVYALNPHSGIMKQLSLPCSAVYNTCSKTMRQKTKDFISILRKWATNYRGCIPYVLGGCSYTEVHDKNIFKVQRSHLTMHPLLYYNRPITRAVKTGFDCSNLILRAAQIVGIPYYFKNTYTLSDILRPLSSKDTIIEGDLIWMPGHVIIISDIKKNLIIEAHSYDGGYGRIHEMPLAKIFKNIYTFAELQTAYNSQKELQRLASNGRIQQTYKQFKILKLAAARPT